MWSEIIYKVADSFSLSYATTMSPIMAVNVVESRGIRNISGMILSIRKGVARRDDFDKVVSSLVPEFEYLGSALKEEIRDQIIRSLNVGYAVAEDQSSISANSSILYQLDQLKLGVMPFLSLPDKINVANQNNTPSDYENDKPVKSVSLTNEENNDTSVDSNESDLLGLLLAS